MSTTIVRDCPRCGAAQHTFDVVASWPIKGGDYEIVCICRRCRSGTIFVTRDFKALQYLAQRYAGIANLNIDISGNVADNGFVSIADLRSVSPPEHSPEPVSVAFQEGAKCFAIGCWNAAGAMFRTCLDLSTKEILQKAGDKPIGTLFARLEWMFKNGRLPADLRDLSDCIREDGNDGVHEAGLGEPDAEHLLDFATRYLEVVYTIPGRIAASKKQRQDRRQPPAT